MKKDAGAKNAESRIRDLARLPDLLTNNEKPAVREYEEHVDESEKREAANAAHKTD